MKVSTDDTTRWLATLSKANTGGATAPFTDPNELQLNLRQNCIPTDSYDNYDAFLVERRKLMSARIKHYFNTL